MKPRAFLPRISKKKLAAANGKPIYSTIASPRKAVRKSKRSKSEFARIYHSAERVAFVKSLPCASCGRTGVFIDNAHIETGGTGYKADYTKIIPLCGHFAPRFSCHGRLHRHGREDLELWGGINLEAEASKVQIAWLSIKGEEK